MPNVIHKRGTRAALNALSASSGLLVGQIYVITDEQRISIATAANSYREFARADEATKITVGTTAPASPSVGDLWVDTN